ncbi:MAG: DoxX family protein [Proteobacteria bacterium]|nr:DoxX family protein [Pseudomonadota bacterium]
MLQTSLIFDFLDPVYGTLKEYADPALRLTAGGFLIPHGAQKLFGWFGGYGLEGTAGYFEGTLGFSNGLLAVLASGSIEFFGGALLAFGLFTRPVAAIIAGFLLVALTFHFGNGFIWTDLGYEYPLMWAILVATFMVRGGGRYSLDRLIGKEF